MNGVDIAILVGIIIFVLFIIGVMIYRKVRYGTGFDEECAPKMRKERLLRGYHRKYGRKKQPEKGTGDERHGSASEIQGRGDVLRGVREERRERGKEDPGRN